MAKELMQSRNPDTGEFIDEWVDMETDFALFIFDENDKEIMRFPGDSTFKTSPKGKSMLGFVNDENVEIFRNGELIHSFIGQTVNGYCGRITTNNVK